MNKIVPALLLAIHLTLAASVRGEVTPVVDSVTFGDPASERAHAFEARDAAVFAGALNQPARRLLPVKPASWEGGSMKFVLKVDPARANYATLRLWGSDVTLDCLVLYCEGKQVGYRHLGDIDILDIGGGGPGFPGRFYYTTTPLPEELTRGKTAIQCEIRSSGPMWPYGETFERFQHAMTEPTRGIYSIYTHTNGWFEPPSNETQGAPVTNPPVRPGPGPEVLVQLKQRVDGEVRRLLALPKPLDQMQAEFIARAYGVKWTSAFQSQTALAQLVRSLDHTFVAYRANPHLAESDPVTPNPDWFGLGPSGDILRLVGRNLSPAFDELIADGRGARLTRRAAYVEMLVACREWHRRHRRLYTNQTMINDLYGIYLPNRAVALLDPAQAMPEDQVKRYLYESVGLQPWRDSDAGAIDGPRETGGRAWGVGPDYWEVTAKGLTKELGYVGYYGEVLDWVTTIYEATRPAEGQPGDPRILAQLERMGHARSYFRYPLPDDEGFRAMRIEAIVGWRDPGHYPGDVTYAERNSWDGSCLYSATSTLDPEAIGYVQQMLADNQFFASVRERMQDRGLRVTAGLLGVPDQYETLRGLPPVAARLPMTPGQPDFVFSDEEDGVLAVKHGEDRLYIALYWRAHQGINRLARVHYITPQLDRIAVVHEETRFDSSGLSYTRADRVVGKGGNGGPKYPVTRHLAEAGEQLPIARIPEGAIFQPGDESVYAGKGTFYILQYGPYLVAMNLTKDRTFDLVVPAAFAGARELVSGRDAAGGSLAVGPRSTVLLKLP